MRLPFVLLSALALALGGAQPASALMLGSEIDVQLASEGDSLVLSDTVMVIEPGTEILPGDGTNIASVLLPSEFVDLGVGVITINLEEGVPGGTTGYAPNARYVFTRLFEGTGLGVFDVAVTLVNITGFDASDLFFNSNRIAVFIDDLVIGDITGVDNGQIILTVTSEVPEPALAGLALSVAAAFALRGRR